MFLRTVETAFARYQRAGEAAALAIVFDRCAPELLRLARHLARDANQAEDLVQATFLTAIEKANDHERGRPVLPWLCGILANHARMQRRTQTRVPDADRLRRDVVQDVHAEVAASELHQQVRDAITSLPEAYRPVLRLWLEHGLEAQEIAATLERPQGTVRAQVARGLEQLRRALPASVAGATALAVGAGRGLAAVRQRVLEAGGGTSTGLTTTLAITGLLMLHHKIMIGGVAAALSLLLWFAWSPTDIGPTDATDTPKTAPAATGALANETGTAAPTVPAASERETAPETPTADEPIAPAPARTSLLVRLLDADTGRALADYGVAIGAGDALQAFGRLPQFLRTNERGEVTFDDPVPGQAWLLVDRAQSPFSVQIRAGKANTRELPLPSTHVITGTVRTAEGQPSPHAEVFVVGNWVQPTKLATADAAGRFRIEHAQMPRLLARANHCAPSLAEQFDNRNRDLDVTLELGEGGRRIRGVVLDEQGQALPNAVVAILPEADLQVHPFTRGKPLRIALCIPVNEHGEFVTDEVAAGRHLAMAIATDASIAPPSRMVDTTNSDAHVELRCAAPTRIVGRLLGSDVKTADARILAFPEQPTQSAGYLLNLVGMRTTTVQRDGSFELLGVVPGKISLRAMHGMQLLAETRFELTAGQTHRWTPQLGAAAKLTVFVSAPTDLPTQLLAIVHTEVDGAMPSIAAVQRDGSASFELQRTGPVRVTLATVAGMQIVQFARAENIAPEQDEVRFELRAEQLLVGSVRGRLLAADAAPIVDQPVHLRRIDAPGLTVMLQCTTSSDGSFVVGPVPAGTYQLATGKPPALVPLQTVEITVAGDEHLGDVRRAR